MEDKGYWENEAGVEWNKQACDGFGVFGCKE